MKVFYRLFLAISFLFLVVTLSSSCTTDSVDSAVEGDQNPNSINKNSNQKNEDGDIIDETTDGGEEKSNANNDFDPERLPGRKWRRVTEIKGSKNMKTKPFKIKGKEWKVNWNVVEKGQDNGEFIVILHNKKDRNDTEIIAQQTGSGEDFAPFEGGQGEYFFEVTSSQPYTIEVHEYK